MISDMSQNCFHVSILFQLKGLLFWNIKRIICVLASGVEIYYILRHIFCLFNQKTKLKCKTFSQHKIQADKSFPLRSPSLYSTAPPFGETYTKHINTNPLPSPLQASCPSVSRSWKPEPKLWPSQSTRRKKDESDKRISFTDVCIPAKTQTTHFTLQQYVTQFFVQKRRVLVSAHLFLCSVKWLSVYFCSLFIIAYDTG